MQTNTHHWSVTTHHCLPILPCVSVGKSHRSCHMQTNTHHW
jgi:hypothetical protein